MRVCLSVCQSAILFFFFIISTAAATVAVDADAIGVALIEQQQMNNNNNNRNIIQQQHQQEQQQQQQQSNGIKGVIIKVGPGFKKSTFLDDRHIGRNDIGTFVVSYAQLKYKDHKNSPLNCATLKKYSRDLITCLCLKFYDKQKFTDFELDTMTQNVWLKMSRINSVRGFIFKTVMLTINWISNRCTYMEPIHSLIFISCFQFLIFMEDQITKGGDKQCIITSAYVFIREVYVHLNGGFIINEAESKVIIDGLNVQLGTCSNNIEYVQVVGVVCAQILIVMYENFVVKIMDPARLALKHVIKRITKEIPLTCPMHVVKGEKHDCKFKKKRLSFFTIRKIGFLDILTTFTRDTIQKIGQPRVHKMEEMERSENLRKFERLIQNNNVAAAAAPAVSHINSNINSQKLLNNKEKLQTIDLGSLMKKETEKNLVPTLNIRSVTQDHSVYPSSMSSRENDVKRRLKRKSLFRDDNNSFFDKNSSMELQRRFNFMENKSTDKQTRLKEVKSVVLFLDEKFPSTNENENENESENENKNKNGIRFILFLFFFFLFMRVLVYFQSGFNVEKNIICAYIYIYKNW